MASDLLSREDLPTTQAILSLGLVISKTLQEGKPITLFLNKDNCVEIAPYEEILLDTKNEEEAVTILLESGYESEQLLAYLAGRRARRGE